MQRAPCVESGCVSRRSNRRRGNDLSQRHTYAGGATGGTVRIALCRRRGVRRQQQRARPQQHRCAYLCSNASVAALCWERGEAASQSAVTAARSVSRSGGAVLQCRSAASARRRSACTFASAACSETPDPRGTATSRNMAATCSHAAACSSSACDETASAAPGGKAVPGSDTSRSCAAARFRSAVQARPCGVFGAAAAPTGNHLRRLANSSRRVPSMVRAAAAQAPRSADTAAAA